MIGMIQDAYGKPASVIIEINIDNDPESQMKAVRGAQEKEGDRGRVLA